jgi:hypothetical protein
LSVSVEKLRSKKLMNCSMRGRAAAGDELQILEPAERLEHGARIGDEAHVAFDVDGVRAHVEARDGRRPRARLEHAREHAQGRRLAGAVRTEKPDDDTSRDLE